MRERPALLIGAPQRPGQAGADHHLHAQRLAGAGDEDVGIWHVHEVVGHHVRGAPEPGGGEPVEQLALEGHGGEDAVERGEAVRGDELQAVPGAVRVPHLAGVAGSERVQVRVAEGVRQLRGEGVSEGTHGEEEIAPGARAVNLGRTGGAAQSAAEAASRTKAGLSRSTPSTQAAA